MSLKDQFRNVQKLPDWIYWIPIHLLFLICRLKRIRFVDPDGRVELKDPPYVMVTWHNRLFMFPFVFPKWHRNHTMAVISASRDGQYIADIARIAGVGSVRGSTKKGALNALLGAERELKNGNYVAFTPDGPRGPRYHMSIGPVYLASKEQVRLLPLAINYSSYWALKSWDGFRIPKPWAKITVVIGDPFLVPPDLSPEELEKWRVLAEDRLNAVSEVTDEEKRQAAEAEQQRLARRAAKLAKRGQQ